MSWSVTFSPLLEGTAFQRQRELEQESIATAIRRYRAEVREKSEKGEGSQLRAAESLMLAMHNDLREAIVTEKRCFAAGNTEDGRAYYGPFLAKLPAAVLSVLTLHEAISAAMENPLGVPYTTVAHSVGSAVIAELHLRAARTERMLVGPPGREKEQTKHTVVRNTRRNLRPVHINWWCKRNLDAGSLWNRQACSRIGDGLLSRALDALALEMDDGTFRPTFMRWMQRRGRKTVWMFGLSDEGKEVIDHAHAVRKGLRPRCYPMIVPPMPYQQLDDDEGGALIEGPYTSIRRPLVIQPSKTLKRAMKRADLKEFLSHVSAVNATAWRINRGTLRQVHQIVADGGGSLDIPILRDIPKPPVPADIDRNPEALARWKAELAEWHGKMPGIKGQRREFAEMMHVVDKMEGLREEGYDRFFSPHRACFRGRLYSDNTFLNHQGDDLRRGLLEFADGVNVTADAPEGEEASAPYAMSGMMHLYVHAANCFGKDKLPYTERAQWALDHQAMMLRIAKDPGMHASDWTPAFDSKGKQISGAEKPWQFLAACLAIADPAAAAHLPGQIDGTCNGLQVFAAMVRDPEAGAAVNMLPSGPSDRPADAYSGILAPTARAIAEAAGRGVPEAIRLAGMIDRDLVKQPFMTTYYDVTPSGMRSQIRAKLEERGVVGDEAYAASRYLQEVIQAAIGKAYPRVAEAMNWFKACAGACVRETGRPFGWTNPLGFPVIIPRWKWSEHEVRTVSGSLRLRVDEEDLGPDIQEQIRGSAPDMVHSFDGSVMMATGMACYRDQMAFAAVHDNHWSHLQRMNRLHRHTREQFVRMLPPDVLPSLHRQWTQMFHVELPEPPRIGELDLNGLARSAYFFS